MAQCEQLNCMYGVYLVSNELAETFHEECRHDAENVEN